MKRAFCFFLMVWLVLQAGMAQAHVLTEDVAHHAHQAARAAQTNEQAPEQVVEGAAAAHQSGDADRCSVPHCCHASCLPMAYGIPRLGGPLPSKAPTAFALLALRVAPADIERPRWATATPAVARLNS